MPRISTRLDVHSQEFQDNARAMRSLVEDLRREAGRAARGGSKAATDKHRAAGKLTARERIRVLLDTGSPFLEFSQLAAHGMYGGEIACAGVVTGIGRIGGRECVIVANDPTVKGGTYYPVTVKKHLRAQEIATTACRACTWWRAAALFCRRRMKCFPTARTSAASSTTRRRCRRSAWRRSR